jgi:hypothetical protein
LDFAIIQVSVISEIFTAHLMIESPFELIAFS